MDDNRIQLKELRENAPDELRRTLRSLEENLFKSRMKKVTNQLEDTSVIRKARRDIARLKTVLREMGQSEVGKSVVSKET